jgi:hypothetical protein
MSGSWKHSDDAKLRNFVPETDAELKAIPLGVPPRVQESLRRACVAVGTNRSVHLHVKPECPTILVSSFYKKHQATGARGRSSGWLLQSSSVPSTGSYSLKLTAPPFVWEVYFQPCVPVSAPNITFLFIPITDPKRIASSSQDAMTRVSGVQFSFIEFHYPSSGYYTRPPVRRKQSV